MSAFLVAGEVHSAAGSTLEANASACVTGRTPEPVNLELPYLQGQIVLPYFAAGVVTTADETLLRIARAALAQAGIISVEELAATALLLGTSSGDVGRDEALYAAELAAGKTALPVRDPSYGRPAQRVAAALGISGPIYTLTTACSAAANALLLGAQLIEAGRVRHALVLGMETQNRVSLLGFHGLMLTARSGYRPFDARRDGIVLGEALGAAVLSSEPRASAWQLLGGASLCDSAHPTSSSPDGIARVITAALANAGVSASQIVAVKAHGTGTPSNDEAEARGLQQAFGASTMPPFTSLKSSLGHTLGACGVVETLTLLRAIERSGLPATAGFAEADPALAGMAPVQHCTPLPRGPVLLNYFGFGGNNCALLFAPC